MSPKRNELTRRDFLTKSTTVGIGMVAASSLYGCSSPGPKPASGMKFGLVTYLWGKVWDLPTLIKNCEIAN